MANIVETAVQAGSFNTLVAAVKAAGLAETLSGEGPFTLFAPSDGAFAKLPEGTVEGLLHDRPKLEAILKYHVVAGKISSAEAANASSATTVQGENITINADNGSVRINNAQVLQADIETDNGIIHVIDNVILPSDS